MKLFRRLLLGLAVLLVVATVGAWLFLRASLPELDGERPLAELVAEVTVDRDSLGVPHIRASTRADAARALGYVHAQERRFQMDLLRRAASGELAALLGPAMVSADSVLRPHLFRERAAEAFEALPAEHQDLLRAYASGANAGTDALGARPFEYAVLRQRPEPWRPEDALLVAYAMTLDLQRADLDDELLIYARERGLPPALARFLDPPGDAWDAPLTGEAFVPAPVPTLDSLGGWTPSATAPEASGAPSPLAAARAAEATGDLRAGSNNWAVAGGRSATGGAIVADDMHLGLGVPPIWYRASMTVQGASGEARTVTGVTLPGTPLVIVGSNGSVAWGFTNSYGDYVDLVRLVMEPGMTNLVQTDSATVELVERREWIRVAGADSVALDVTVSPWGPVTLTDGRGDRYAVQWGAHRAASTNLELIGMETARTLEDALDVANRAGIPAQNFVAGDASGQIGWTIAGQIPLREGRDGQRPVDSTDPRARWTGFVPPAAVPRVTPSDSGAIWTANNRVASGEALAIIGDGGYAHGARAHQIRQRLNALTEPATERDLFAIQLDDEALFLRRWHALLTRLTDGDAITEPAVRETLRQRLGGWTGSAHPEDTAYGLVKGFRAELAARLRASYLGGAERVYGRTGGIAEAALWTLATEQPAHLLPLDVPSWDALLATAAAHAAAETPEDWGTQNAARIEHPMADALPLVGRFLRMPGEPLAGDSFTPRVTAPSFGASQRMVVTPGREAEGILHIPGGQAGHPLSPYWGAGHDAWVEGRALPFLPGRAQWTLRLVPAG